MRLAGQLVTGQQAGSGWIALPWVTAWLEERLSLRPYPGTLNVRLDPAAERRWLAFRASGAGLRLLSSGPEFCDSHWFTAHVDKLRAVIVVPDLPDYPPDQLEIVAEEHLRSSLALTDGSSITVVVHPDDAAGYGVEQSDTTKATDHERIV
jgi:riboflavin kinase